MAKSVDGLWEQQEMTLAGSQQGINRDLILTTTKNTSANNLKELEKNPELQMRNATWSAPPGSQPCRSLRKNPVTLGLDSRPTELSS